VQPQAPQKSHGTKASQLFTSKSELQADPDPEHPDQAHKQPSEHLRDSVSALNALKKLPRFHMTEQEGLAAEEAEESKGSL
jgi:hypothetical protein